MFIIVKYGQNETLLCNPMCATINLLNSIKNRAGYGNSNVVVDLSDETGIHVLFVCLSNYLFVSFCFVYCVLFVLPMYETFTPSSISVNR